MNDVDIRTFLQMMGVVHVRKSGGNITAECPFGPYKHSKGSDSHPSFSVKINITGKSVANCFACKTSGTLLQLANEFNNYAHAPHVIQFVKDNEWMEPKEDKPKTFGHKLDWRKAKWLLSGEEQKEVIMHASKVFDEDAVQTIPLEKITKYLKSIPAYVINRGISKQTAKDWSLGYDKKMLRVVMPVFDRRNRLVGYAKRDITPEKKDLPKYLFNRGFEKEFYLYGENLISPSRGDIVVVEGQFDALKVYQAGFNAVAVLGSFMSETQACKIKDALPLGKKVIIMMDGDEAGEKATEQILTILSDKVYAAKRILPSGKDPGEMTESQIKEMVYRNEYK